MLRPTQSPGLYLQIVGRGMRIAEGKTDALVLDFAGNIARHGPVDDVRPPRAPGEKGNGDAPFKPCPKCKARMHPKATYCGDCGYEFPVVAAHDASATSAAIMKRDLVAVRYENPELSYTHHHKPGAPTSLRVDYHSGLRRVASEWICLEHDGFARTKARLWWKKRAGKLSEPPATIDEAMSRIAELATPSAVVVNETGKYPELIRVILDEADAERKSQDAGNAADGYADRASATGG